MKWILGPAAICFVMFTGVEDGEWSFMEILGITSAPAAIEAIGRVYIARLAYQCNLVERLLDRASLEEE